MVLELYYRKAGRKREGRRERGKVREKESKREGGEDKFVTSFLFIKPSALCTLG